MDSFELGVQSGMEKAAAFDKEAIGLAGLKAFGSRAMGRLRHGKKITTLDAAAQAKTGLPQTVRQGHLAEQAKAMGVSKGELGKAMGNVDNAGLKNLADLKNQGALTHQQTKNVAVVNRMKAQEAAAEAAKKNAVQGMMPKKTLGEQLKGVRRAGTAAAIGLPALAVTSGAGQGVQAGMNVNPQGY
jgi:hypothetical protein